MSAVSARSLSHAQGVDRVRALQRVLYLVWHELEFREGGSFTYVVRDTEDGYLGCAYLYPMGGRTRLSEELLGYDVDVSWWVTPTAYARSYYQMLYRGLRHWLAEDFPFKAPYYSNREIPDEG